MSDQQIVVTDGTTPRTYIATEGPSGEYWFRDESSTLLLPNLLRVAINVPKSGVGTLNAIVQLIGSKLNSDGVPVTHKEHIVVQMPLDGPTEAEMSAEHAYLVNFVGSTQFLELIKGFVPTKEA